MLNTLRKHAAEQRRLHHMRERTARWWHNAHCQSCSRDGPPRPDELAAFIAEKLGLNHDAVRVMRLSTDDAGDPMPAPPSTSKH